MGSIDQALTRAADDRAMCSSAPIYCLPDELLIKIFAVVLALDCSDGGHRPLITLGLVSTNWSRIVFETPSLWGHISSSHSDEENRAAIRLSKGYTLRVDYDDDQLEQGGGYEAAFIRSASQEAHRWQSADLRLGNNTLPLLHDFVTLAVPRLEELRINCDRVSEAVLEGVSIDILGGGVADRLRHVMLCDFPIPWNSHLFARLETLSIITTLAFLAPTTDEITAILRQCPELREFSLIKPGGDEMRVPAATLAETEVVHLPVLTSFGLCLLNDEAFNRIISSVRFPACTKFDFKCYRPASSIISGGTGHLTAVLSSKIQSLLNISLILTPRGLDLVGTRGPGNSRFSLFISHTSSWEDLAQLIEHITGSIRWPPVQASISCQDSIPFLQVADLLRRIPSITKLNLIGHSDRHIALLSQPILNNGRYEWVLPNLEGLYLEGSAQNDVQLLIDFQAKRQEGAGMYRGDGVPLGLPTKLETIYVSGPFREKQLDIGPFYTALQELKGEDWDGNLIN
ncbi:hypothetical protein FRB94_003217 [Tulasnella sp. JGI-2019a]|nr:hypothetical protein FRB93_004146 [Tulasnella sp. JGI-2019a]KAG9003333.1 hypothetical protein FRB94_003217 [Tulasnella sp. JGI-2019a]